MAEDATRTAPMSTTDTEPTEELLAEGETPRTKTTGSSWPLETIHSEEETRSVDAAFDVASAASSSDELLLQLPKSTAFQQPKSRGVATVTTERKHELLLQARADRLRWIQKVPLPFLNAGSLDPLETFLTNSHASLLLPNVSGVLYHLYGGGEDASAAKSAHERLASTTTNNTTDTPMDSIYLTGNQILSNAIKKAEEDGDADTKEHLLLYQRFLKQLEDPSSNTIVQGMRTFCRNFVDHDEVKAAATQIQSYVKSTAGKFPDEMQPCLEAFVYGHCREAIERIAKRSEAQEDTEFDEKVESLQFVNPSHLDITIDEDLVPIRALRGVDKHHSVYDKLQMILQMYKGVNEALKKASDSLPSADDVLPGIIYTVLRAKANRLCWNLQFIEQWSPQEHLRGEAGYAFTNLYGAMQFLRDLKDSSSLTISELDFTQKMAECRSQVEERIKQRRGAILDPTPTVKTVAAEKERVRAPTAAEIRQARKNGEIINLQWALAWQKNQPVEQKEEQDDPLHEERRQYSFLGTKADDIRLRDLPNLLEEYRELYFRNENYVSEKAKRASRARRKHNDDVEKDLIATARSLDLL